MQYPIFKEKAQPRSSYRALAACLTLLIAIIAYGNIGPFVTKYPNGDPGAKGVLARLDPILHPARESRLRVVQEDLSFHFVRQESAISKRATGDQSVSLEALFPRRISATNSKLTPLVKVAATYKIENPTEVKILVDFGFPIIRGIYVEPYDKPTPDVDVMVDGQSLGPEIISTDLIYGIIRQCARKIIEEGVKKDANLARLVAAVREASGISASVQPKPPQQNLPATTIPNLAQIIVPIPTAGYMPARERLFKYLIAKKHWNDRDASLMTEYAGLDFDTMRSIVSLPREDDDSMVRNPLVMENLGPLFASHFS